jgi:hypothetical protein
MNFNKQINNVVNENHNNYIIYNIINNEINYNELKHYSIKTFNNNFYQLKKYEKNFNIYILKKLYNESDYNLKVKILFNSPDFYTVILNDFTKFIFELVQKTKQNIRSLIFNYCFKDGYKFERLPEYKYHYYLTHNKETCLYNWFNEYKELLYEHLHNNLNNDLYIRQTNIIIKLVEIKAELKEKKEIVNEELSINLETINENSNDNLNNNSLETINDISLKDLETINDISLKDLETINEDDDNNSLKDLESINEDDNNNSLKDLETINQDDDNNSLKDLETINEELNDNSLKDLEINKCKYKKYMLNTI